MISFLRWDFSRMKQLEKAAKHQWNILVFQQLKRHQTWQSLILTDQWPLPFFLKSLPITSSVEFYRKERSWDIFLIQDDVFIESYISQSFWIVSNRLFMNDRTIRTCPWDSEWTNTCEDCLWTSAKLVSSKLDFSCVACWSISERPLKQQTDSIRIFNKE